MLAGGRDTESRSRFLSLTALDAPGARCHWARLGGRWLPPGFRRIASDPAGSGPRRPGGPGTSPVHRTITGNAQDLGVGRVTVSWKGNPHATPTKGREARTNVMPVLES